MPKRINANIDMDILADVSTGMLRKEVAAKHGVSASYVSKLCNGKKVPDIYIPELSKIIDEEFEAYEGDIDAVVEMITRRNIIVSKQDIIKYLEGQIQRSIIRVKMYIELIKTYKGE